MPKKILDKLLSTIPFDSIRQWLSDNPFVAFIMLLVVIFIICLGGLHIA